MSLDNVSLIIIGSGPAGYTAAIYAARFLLKPLLFTGNKIGGQLTLTKEIENYPGFNKNIDGNSLMNNMENQAKRFGTKIFYEKIINVNFLQYPFILESFSKKIYKSKSIIIATGGHSKYLGIDNEEQFIGKGISTCAICDGLLYRNKNIIIVGGGNSALEEAIYLSSIVKKVTIIHRRSKFKADNIIKDKLLHYKNIKVIFNSVICKIISENKSYEILIKGVIIRNVISKVENFIKTKVIFLAIGHYPDIDLCKNQIIKITNGHIWTKDNSTATNIPGIFAAGDVANSLFKQAIIAAGSGCMAAIEAKNFLENQEK